ncbi:MarR family transcriptional regulator [Sphingomonas psychrotolerans]|uniref:MarR family transcriptional regulator n=1 Tax=Sphingomonas psychrotolerans TaxID=1327635 RepID=A0ABU3N3S9_9SPHN|nr:MarR family transcriptional regulator [Sphingomonas psychrotolerans]MDT8759190.1 MarR family transcriptional regulator [Sphingomonas psychrotolerans]
MGAVATSRVHLPDGAARRQASDRIAKVDFGQLNHLLGYAIARADIRADATFHAAMSDRTVTPLRYAMLELVGSNPGLHQVQLADALGVSRPAVTLLLDYWQTQGCVERCATPFDRRSLDIFLTLPGDDRLAELRRRTRAQDRQLSDPLTSAERAELARLLNKLGSFEK